MLHFPPPTPVVANGAELPDHYARRVVASWLARLAFEGDRNRASLIKMLDSSRAVGGTPEAQVKFFNRFAASLGDTLLCSALEPGKRAKYKFAYDALMVDQPDMPGAPVGMDWLFVSRMFIHQYGPNRRPQFSNLAVLGVSAHALARLVQRAGVETHADFTRIMQEAWRPATIQELYMRNPREAGDERALLIPVRMPCGPSDIGAFISMPAKDSDGDYAMPVAKTFISGIQMSVEQHAACIDFLDAIQEIPIGREEDEMLAALEPIIDRLQCRD